jgi:hypothetical protein
MALTVDFGTNPVVAMMEYADIGYNISQGNGYSMHPLMIKDAPPVVTAFMPSAQSFISAFLLSAFGNGAQAAGFILNVLLTLVTVVVIAKTVGSITENEGYVHIALWITALYPLFVAMNATFGIAVPVAMLTAVIFYYISRAFSTRTDKRSSRRYIISTGTAKGITMLFPAVMPLFIIFSAAMVLLYQKSSGWVNASLIIGVPLFVALRRSIRNYSVFERFIPMSSNGGLNFWRGNNKITFGNFRRSDDPPVWTIEPLWNEDARYIHDPKTFDKAALIFPQPRLQIFTGAAYFPLTAAGIIISFDLLRKVFYHKTNQGVTNVISKYKNI